MTLLRLIARPLLASIFIVQGARELKDPEPLAPKAKAVADQLLPQLRRVAPAQVADRIPEDPRTLVRINGAVRLLGGLALATGRFRRLGALSLFVSLAPTTMAGHAFWQETDGAQRSNQQAHFLKNLSMAGGLLLAAVDTEGKPGLMWRASHQTRRGAREAKRASRRAARTARQQAKRLHS